MAQRRLQRFDGGLRIINRHTVPLRSGREKITHHLRIALNQVMACGNVIGVVRRHLNVVERQHDEVVEIT